MMSFFGRITRKQWLIGSGVAALALIAVATVGAFALGGGTENDQLAAPEPSATNTATPTRTPTPRPSPTPVLHSGVIDGVPMTATEWEARKDLPVIAMMIDNNPAAWPHSGLDQADMVVEAFVEGSITRYMAVFWRRDVGFIEPVRSARTPFVIWAGELDALYGHAGSAELEGPACASCQMAEWGIKDMDSFYGPPSNAYYRDGTRYAPHNLVTSTTAIYDAAAVMGWKTPPTVQPWVFKDDHDGTEDLPDVQGMQIDFGSADTAWHVTQWRWDEARNVYLRWAMGNPHVDGKSGQQLAFKNVIVMRAPWVVADRQGHVTYEQIGSGPVTVYLDGKVIEGEWRKPDRLARTRFYDAAGKEIALNRGPVWIAMIGPGERVLTAPTPDGIPPIPPFSPGPAFDGGGGGGGGVVDEPDDTLPPTSVPPTAGPTGVPTDAPVTPTTEPPTAVPTEVPPEPTAEPSSAAP